MNLKNLVAGAAIGCAVGATGLVLGSGVANAAPPCMPGPGVQCGPGGPGGQPQGGPDDWHNQGGPGGPGDWHPPRDQQSDRDWRGRFQGAPWGNDLPPWGWGAPPPAAFNGPPPPPWGAPPAPVNYWGFQEQPIFDPGFNQWGFWFFGIWIPWL